jgi:ribosomal protein S6
MAQQIATISLAIFIILIQHVYHWGIRKLYNKLEEDGIAAYFVITLAWSASTITLFRLLIEINK